MNDQQSLEDSFQKVALDPEFGQILNQLFQQMESPVYAAGIALAQVVEKVEAKLGTMNDEVLYGPQGVGTKFVITILTMADEAGLPDAANAENVESAVQLAAILSATSGAIASMQEGGPQQGPPQAQPQPQGRAGGLMGAMA